MRSDCVFIQNDFDKMTIAEFASISHSICLPTPVNSDRIDQAVTTLETIDLSKRHSGNLAFWGDFNDEADKSNLAHLIKDIWPSLIASRPDMRLDILGSGIDRDVIQLCSSQSNIRPVV